MGRMKRNNSSQGHGKAVWVGRVLFISCLVTVAVALGYISYYFVSQSEKQLAIAQYDSLSDRALVEIKGALHRHRESLISISLFVSEINPNADDWPFIYVDRFTQIANASIEKMGIAPLVRPEQVQEFETYATDRFEQQFGNATAAQIWVYEQAPNETTTTTAPKRTYHDVSGRTAWGSVNEVLFPILLASSGYSPSLMNNLHSDPEKGLRLDDMIQCSKEKEQKNETDNIRKCGVNTKLAFPLREISKGPGFVDRGPGTSIYQPVYAKDRPFELVGIVMSHLLWKDTLVNVFASEVRGIDCIVTSEDESYTFTVESGVAHANGYGDLHQRQYDPFQRSYCHKHSPDNDSDLYTDASPEFCIHLYLNDEFLHVYSTNNPIAACIGAVLIILFTSLMFLFYDIVVRKEFSAKHELLEAKRKFMRYVSHEVRTPLNAAGMSLSLIQSELANLLGLTSDEEIACSPITLERLAYDNPEKKKTTECLCLIQDTQAHMQSAVDVLSDLLTYDRIDRGELKLELSLINIWSVIKFAAAEFVIPASKKGISFVVEYSAANNTVANVEELDASVQGTRAVVDAVRLTQSIRNLISNAVKFTPEGGKIRLTASLTNDDDASGCSNNCSCEFDLSGGKIRVCRCGFISIEVQDNGAGMTQDQIQRSFRDGAQFNVNQLQSGGGSGLGLFITKGFIEQMGGTVSVKSEGLGKGSTFAIQLPIYSSITDMSFTTLDEQEGSSTHYHDGNRDPETHIKASPPIPSVSPPSKKLRILIVEDVKSNSKLLNRILTKQGHTCDEAEDGIEAIDKVVASIECGVPYETILMDYEMPRKNGPEATMELRELGAKVFIVGITGNMLPEDIAHFMACGANAVLAKPFKLHELVNLWIENDII